MDSSPENEDFPGRLLHQAALWDNIELLQDLLTGEQLNYINSLDSWGRSPIHAAAVNAESKCLKLLIAHDCDLNLRCGPHGEYKTALHLSAEHGHESNVEALLTAGASFTVKDSNGLTPLDLAERAGHTKCMEILRNIADAREQIRSKKHLELREAVLSGDINKVKILLDALGSQTEIIVNMVPTGTCTLLFAASTSGHDEIVNMLLEAGADGRAHAVTKYSPLYIAAYRGRIKVIKLLLDRFPESVQQLTLERWLPLHAACINGHISAVDLLLNYPYPESILTTIYDSTGEYEWKLPFDPNTQDVVGQTALYISCLLGNKQLVDLLLNWKPKCTQISSKKEAGTPDSPTSSSSQLSPSKRRISYGIQSIMSRLSLGRDSIDEGLSKETLKSPLDLNALCTPAKETALLASVRDGHLDIVSMLLSNGADPNIVGKPVDEQNGSKTCDEIYGLPNTALAEAAKLKSQTLPMVELLLKYGAKDDHSTALTLACMHGDEQIICRLLSIKAYPDPEYKINKKALSSDPNFTFLTSSMPSLTYSSLFPNTPTMINWHSNKCQLNDIRLNWLSEAALHCNPKLKGHPKSNALALGGITRIDISHNCLTSLPPEIFSLHSLRYLNIAQNKLEKLPTPEDLPMTPEKKYNNNRNIKNIIRDYNCPVLEELYLQDNRLESIPFAVFRLPSLLTLDVSNNKLQQLPFEMWRAPKLRELNVAFNLLKDLPSLPNETNCCLTEPPSPVSESFLFNQTLDESYQQKNKIVSQIELFRHNIWSKSLEVTDQELRLYDSKNEDTVSQLTTLNLANNLFTSIPIALPCLAVNLTRLNMSYNSLRSMGHVTSYPASLKQLDLGHNEITCWPSLPRIAMSDPHLACYNPQENKNSKNLSKNSTSNSESFNNLNEIAIVKTQSHSSITSLRSAVLKSVCCHRRHLRLESLRTLVLADNLLTRIQLSTDDVATLSDAEDAEWSLVGVAKARLIFPNLSMLDISNNCLKEIPHSIHELNNLSVLNISGNVDVSELPPHMGLLSRLWNLNTRGCSLQDPLKSMIDSKKYKTMDIIGYLKSVYEDAKPYARMKLMVVGVQGIGKTSLLDQLRQEGPNRSKKQVDHWAKRMGHKNITSKTSRGTNMSTVGVDIGDWMCDKKTRNSLHGPVLFRTWDFGGQREYYATHQYFLSKRSLYLVLWKITDGKKGLAEVLQWLGNIQARASNSPVIIVGTHYDVVGDLFPAKKAEELQQIIRERFIAVADAEKMGLPRVLDSIEVSCKTGHNIKLLSNLIYDTAFSLRSPGSKESLLHQKVPASYLALEDVVGSIANSLKQVGADPVLDVEQYKTMVTQEIQQRGYKGFRDNSELNQATMFLHDNGVLLHYDDATLRDLYFLDPQWLCDMLAHVVTVREINPFASTGVMKLDDLQHVFKSSCLGATDNRGYIVSLLNKFEVALTWDSRTLLIPSLLPLEEDSRPGHAVIVKIPARSRGWAIRSKRNNNFSLLSADSSSPLLSSSPEVLQSPISNPLYEVCTLQRQEKSISRLLLMSYFPSGFWSRLITRVLADDQVVEALRNIYPLPKEVTNDPEIMQLLNISSKWNVWQNGLALYYGTTLVFKMREIPQMCSTSIYRNSLNRFKLKQDGIWCDIDMQSTSILEIFFPLNALGVKKFDDKGNEIKVIEIETNIQCLSQLLALTVDHVDILLEDWYPTLGTRFVHTSEGRFLVTRLVPCPKCIRRSEEKRAVNYNNVKTILNKTDRHLTKRLSMDTYGRRDFGGESSGLNELSGILNELNINRKSQDSLGWSDCDSGVEPDSTGSSRAASIEGHPMMNNDDSQQSPPNYSWMVEECILAAYDKKTVACPIHAEIELNVITPDVIFMDLSECYLIKPEDITRGPLLGRGAFGFVFKATCKTRGSRTVVPVAMKMLQPVPPGTRAKESAIIAYKAALGKWERDPLQHSCKAYCTARQELAVLLTLKHSNIVPLVGVCTQPLALVLDLAPLGALDSVLRHYRRNGARIGPYCFQALVLQAARAMEYLHRRHVIYRDLKAENVLVWEFPDPHTEDHPSNSVHIKVADYGISRVTLPSGAKGFGGTEGFMAPEIMRHNGEEEYTEKVDCFSFGMFLYELISLRQPFEGHEAVKECILEGGRPVLTQRETQFPSYCLDLMVLCWDQQPKVRPSASQIVSIASAPEFTHLLDVISLSHNGNILDGVACPIQSYEDGSCIVTGHEIWLPCSNSRIDLLLGSWKGWQEYHRILCPQKVITTVQNFTQHVPMKMTSACLVDTAVWIGDSEGNIYAFNAYDYTHKFSYALEPAQASPVVALVYLNKINRVAAGLENGRLFLLDSTMTPSSITSAEGSFVLTELGSGEKLYSVCAFWYESGACELWCGETDGAINVFTLYDSVVSGHHPLSHFSNSFPQKGKSVTLLYASDNYVYSYVSPGCLLFQWNIRKKEIENRLDCSKLVPCSESLKSISIEEHLSPGKCQVSALTVFDSDLYIGTTWGCIIIVEKDTLRPITVFRPFQEEVRTIIPLSRAANLTTPLIVTIGRGYRSLIDRYTDAVTTHATTPAGNEKRHINSKEAQKDRSQNIHAIIWRADHWNPL